MSFQNKAFSTIHSISSVSIGLLCIFLIQSCEKKYYNGDIVGFVNVYDKDNNKVTDCSGVKIIIEGQSDSKITDKSGRYEFRNMSAGIYSFSFSKSGYTGAKVESYCFAGGSLPGFIDTQELYEFPDISLKSIDFEYDATGFYIKGKVENLGSCSLVFSLYESPEIHPSDYLYRTSGFSYDSDNNYSTTINYSDLFLYSGSTLYLTIYARWRDTEKLISGIVPVNLYQ